MRLCVSTKAGFAAVSSDRNVNRIPGIPDLGRSCIPGIFMFMTLEISIPATEAIRRLQTFLLHIFLFQIFLSGGQHQLDPVQLVDFACSGIVVDGHDIGEREAPAQFLDDAFADHVVGQAAEGLGADDIVDAAVDQFYHLACQEPAFARLVADIDDRFCVFHEFVDADRRCEVPALFKGFGGRCAQLLDRPDAQSRDKRRLAGGSQIIRFVNLVVEAVEHEIQQVGYDSLGAFRF